MAVTEFDPTPPGDDGTNDSESLAPAVTRAAGVLQLLAGNGGLPAGPSELARRLGLPKSSIANICSALADSGLLRRVGTGFSLGRGLAELGGAYLASVDEVQEFYETCHELPSASVETVQLAILDGAEMTYLARHDGQQPVRLTSQIGRRLAASHTATGKAALATLDDEEVRRRFEGRRPPVMTSHSHSTVGALLEDLAVVRQRGYAIDDEETVEGVVCYGIAIAGRRPGEGPYAASITLLKVRATYDREQLLLADLQRLQARLSDPLRAERHARVNSQSR
jgi:IclR family transcriptional regulator, blcABC operon repressor